MWFKLNLYPGRPALRVAVTGNGTPYFMADDVARFLGYINVYGFSKRRATLDLASVIPPCVLARQTRNYRRILVFTFQDMLSMMPVVHRKFKETEKLAELWNRGFVKSLTPPSIEYTALISEVAPELSVSLDEGTILLQDWIREYNRMTMIAFDELQTHDSATQTSESRKIYTFSKDDQIIQTADSMSAENHEIERIKDLIQRCGSEICLKPVQPNKEFVQQRKETEEPECGTENYDHILEIGYDGMLIPDVIYIKIEGVKLPYMQIPNLQNDSNTWNMDTMNEDNQE